MKPKHATITLRAIIPLEKTLEGCLLADLSYLATTGAISLESITVKERPATREECERNADFINEWNLRLETWEALSDHPGAKRAANLAREMRVESGAADDPGAATGAGSDRRFFYRVKVWNGDSSVILESTTETHDGETREACVAREAKAAGWHSCAILELREVV